MSCLVYISGNSGRSGVRRERPARAGHFQDHPGPNTIFTMLGDIELVRREPDRHIAADHTVLQRHLAGPRGMKQELACRTVDVRPRERISVLSPESNPEPVVRVEPEVLDRRLSLGDFAWLVLNLDWLLPIERRQTGPHPDANGRATAECHIRTASPPATPPPVRASSPRDPRQSHPPHERGNTAPPRASTPPAEPAAATLHSRTSP